MPGATPVFGLPFQSLPDPPDGASLGENLALAVEDVIVTRGQARVLCVVSRTAALTLTHSVPLTIPWTVTDIYDPLNMHALNSTDIVLPFTGWYQFSGRVGFAAHATGSRSAILRANGTSLSEIKLSSATGSEEMSMPFGTDLHFLNVNDVITAQARQTSGGNLDTATVSAQFTPRLSIIYFGS